MSRILRSGHTGTLRRAASFAAACALVSSFVELVILPFATNPTSGQGIDVIWANPLAMLLLVVPVALVLWRFFEGLYFWWLAFVIVLPPLLLSRPGSLWALVILSAGIATQGRVLLKSALGHRVVARAGAALATLFVVAASGSQAAVWYRERSTAGVHAPDGAPNVLFLILDTVRGASLFDLGGRAKTPYLDSLAANGVTFERAVSTASWTLPSHASFFTGLWPNEHEAETRMVLDNRPRTLAEVFSAAGFRTGGFVANVVFASRESGLARGFQVYRDFPRTPEAILRASAMWRTAMNHPRLRRLVGFHELLARKSASEVNEEFLDWLDRGGDKPWFAFLNYFDAHEPYLPRAPFKGEYSNGLPRRRFDQFRYWPMEVGINDWTALTPAEVEAERAAYEESITAVDAQLGALLNALQRSGALARTIVVITADHGEQFGEHEAFGHGNTLQWRSIHVPLVVSWPGHLPEGARVSLPVSLRDLPATILSLTLPSGERLPGTPFLGEDAAIAPSPLVLAEAQRSPGWGRPFSLHAVIGEDWLYINAEQGPEHVYHIGRDWYDSLMTDPVRRAAIIQLGRSRLAEAARAESARALRTAVRR